MATHLINLSAIAFLAAVSASVSFCVLCRVSHAGILLVSPQQHGIHNKKHRERELDSIYHLHLRYGPVVLLRPNEVSVAIQEGLRAIYVFGSPKHTWYESEIPNYNNTLNLVSMLEMESHAKRKRMITNAYSKTKLHTSGGLSLILRRLVFQKFLPLIEQNANESRLLNVKDPKVAQWANMDLLAYSGSAMVPTSGGTGVEEGTI